MMIIRVYSHYIFIFIYFLIVTSRWLDDDDIVAVVVVAVELFLWFWHFWRFIVQHIPVMNARVGSGSQSSQ